MLRAGRGGRGVSGGRRGLGRRGMPSLVIVFEEWGTSTSTVENDRHQKYHSMLMKTMSERGTTISRIQTTTYSENRNWRDSDQRRIVRC